MHDFLEPSRELDRLNWNRHTSCSYVHSNYGFSALFCFRARTAH